MRKYRTHKPNPMTPEQQEACDKELLRLQESSNEKKYAIKIDCELKRSKYMNKKTYKETMIIKKGKMVYCVVIEQKDDENKTQLYISGGELYFSDSRYFSASEFEMSDEAHRIAKEIFTAQLQTDIKRRILELQQLEVVLKEIGMGEILGLSMIDNAKQLMSHKVINMKLPADMDEVGKKN